MSVNTEHQKIEDEDEELELVPVDKPKDDKPKDDKPKDDDPEDRPKVISEDEDEEIDEEEREKIRERRRQERKERKKRRDAAMNRDRVELDFLRKRNEDLEKRITVVETAGSSQEIRGFENDLNKVKNDIKIADDIIAKAVEAGEGRDVVDAMKYRDEAIRKSAQIESELSKRKQQQPHQQQQQPHQPQVDPRLAAHANDFMKENSWYDPQGKDEDSAIVLAIDATLAREGYDPTSDDYWDELKDRIEVHLPHHFSKQAKPTPVKGGPQIGSSKEHAPASTRKEVYISPERKSALMEAGVWDDPVLRQKYIKRYMEYDRALK